MSRYLHKKKQFDLKNKTLPLLMVLLSLLLVGCQRNIEPQSQSGFYFDTIISISIYDKRDMTALLNSCMEMCQGYENKFSRTIENSEIWNINHSNGQSVVVSDDTILLLQKALYYADLSDGKVDPTIAPLSSIWNFSEQLEAGTNNIPDADIINSLLPHVDYRKIKISGNTVTLEDSNAAIDLGFIAKGFIADCLKDYLLSENVSSAIINLGGNVLAIGSKPSGDAFQVGIQKPFDSQNSVLLSLPISDLSVVSSGCYERYFQVDNKIYHHILDSATGYPVDNSLYGVTILSSSSTDGDGLSTLCYILGLEKGKELIESLPDIEAIFITNTYEVITTSGISDYTLIE